jgi:putative ABC transport system substrate-binding protein
VPRVGVLQGGQNENVAAFVRGLKDAGYIEGQNVRVETRIYGTKLDHLDDLANEIVGLQCNVIFAAAPYAIKAAMKATATIPIIGIDLESDPVANGWVASIGRPGGNLTGLFLDLPELSGKLIELLKETVPRLDRLGVIWDSTIGQLNFAPPKRAHVRWGLSCTLFLSRVRQTLTMPLNAPRLLGPTA